MAARSNTEQEQMARYVAAYGNHLKDLLASQRGRFALIGKDMRVETFETYEDALTAAYAKFKLEPFLVKKVAAVEEERPKFHLECQS